MRNPTKLFRAKLRRYHRLVDVKFTEGLTPKQQRKYSDLSDWLDRDEEKDAERFAYMRRNDYR